MTDKIIEIKNEAKAISEVADAAREFAAQNHFSEGCCYALAVVFDELLSNIMNYAYHDKGQHNIKVTFSIDGKDFKAKIEDDGVEFNPLNASEADTGLPLEQRNIGGLGIHLVKKMTNKVEYKRVAGKNIVYLLKTDV